MGLPGPPLIPPGDGSAHYLAPTPARLELTIAFKTFHDLGGCSQLMALRYEGECRIMSLPIPSTPPKISPTYLLPLLPFLCRCLASLLPSMRLVLSSLGSYFPRSGTGCSFQNSLPSFVHFFFVFLLSLLLLLCSIPSIPCFIVTPHIT